MHKYVADDAPDRTYEPNCCRPRKVLFLCLFVVLCARALCDEDKFEPTVGNAAEGMRLQVYVGVCVRELPR